jgi:predicted lipid-binding transport protein (Tim44 family)
MKCATHPDREATGFCRTCGKPLCPECTRDVRGILYCEPCLAVMVGAAPAPAQTVEQAGVPNPGVAGALGIIPGLGAIYNGEYVKGLIHIAVFAGIIAILNAPTSDALQAFFGIGLACFICYMPIEAYRTAKMKRAAAYAAYVQHPAATPGPAATAPEGPQAASFAGPAAAPFAGVPGAPAPQAQQAATHGSPSGAIVLIALGVLILLANMGLLSGEWLGHWWPLILIGLGVWLFWKRYQQPGGRGSQQP